MIPRVVDLALVFGMVAVQLLFVIVYQLRTRGVWRRSVIGWHLMAVAVADLGPFLHLAFAMLWPQLVLLGWFQWSYRGSIAAMGAVTLWRVVMAVRTPGDEQAPARPVADGSGGDRSA